MQITSRWTKLKLQGYENGYYIGGCLFDYVKENMRIYKEEILDQYYPS